MGIMDRVKAEMADDEICVIVKTISALADVDERQAYFKLINDTSVSMAVIIRAAKEEGVHFAEKSMARHRTHQCMCYNNSDRK